MLENQEQYKLLTQEFYLDRLQFTNNKNADETEDISAIKVGWQSRKSQYLAFAAATEFNDINWTEITSVLDVGCGYGNLVEYLRKEKNFQGEYTGIEILPEFLEAAQTLYGEDSRNKFILGDFLTQDWQQQQYDIVISLGVISVNYDHPQEKGEKSLYYAKKAISLILNLAKKGISLYFSNSTHVPILQRYINIDMAFYHPLEIQDMIENACKKEYKSLIIESFPEPNNVKTIARINFV